MTSEGATAAGSAVRGSDGRRELKVKRVLRPREQVEMQLKRMILDGSISQGERLPSENQLAEQFAVSRATVREALRSLAGSGLITKTPGAGGGSFVEFIDHNTISAHLTDHLTTTLEIGSISGDEVSEFRNLLEVPCARLAAANRTEEHIERLHAIVELEKSTTVDDPAVPDLNAQFHCTLADASGNRLLAAFVSALHGVTHPLAFVATSPELGRMAVKDHITITDAVAAGNPDKAAAAMQNHLVYLREHAA